VAGTALLAAVDGNLLAVTSVMCVPMTSSFSLMKRTRAERLAMYLISEVSA
jgi:hypothetical protein